MDSDSVRQTISERLTLPADALVFTVVAGALLVIAKDLANIPTPHLDSIHAFLITMTLSSIAGAGAAWFVHRGKSGLRGLAAIALGLSFAVAIVLLAENAMIAASDAAEGMATMAFTIYQAMGAVAVVALMIACATDLKQMSDPRARAIALARLAGLATIAGLIVFRFIPETRADAHAAQVYAVLGLTTVTGSMGVGLGDIALEFRKRLDSTIGRAQRTPDGAC